MAVDYNAASLLVYGILELLSRNWNVSVCHVFREANSAADYLPNFALILPLGPLVLQDPLAGFVVTVWGWYFLAL